MKTRYYKDDNIPHPKKPDEIKRAEKILKQTHV